MSLYTPVFPSFHESSASRKGSPENAVAMAPGKNQCYVDFLRDLHLFLSTRGDVLSPPSRPSSPMFDRRVQNVRDQIQNVLNATGGDAASGKWARVSQTLKLGCVRGRPWSAEGATARAPEEDTEWILPGEESEWMEWEKKRDENRRLKGKTNVAQQIASTSSGSHKTSSVRPYNVAREQRLRDVTPTTLRAAKEKVRKWQASVASEGLHDTTSGTSPSATAIAGMTATKDKAEKPERSRTLDFAVVKPAVRSIIGKRTKGSSSRLDARGGSAPIPSRKPKLSTPSKAGNAPQVKEPDGVDQTGSKQLPTTSLVKANTITDFPETPYIPPSFPEHLETSTPLPDSVMVIRAKPSPILPIPASSSAPLLPTSADPHNDSSQLVVAELHADKMSSCLPPQLPQIDAVHSGKRTRSPSSDLAGRSATPQAKRLRRQSQNLSTPPEGFSKPMSSNQGLDLVPCTRGDAQDQRPGLALSHPYSVDTVGIALGEPSTPNKNNQPLPRMEDTDGLVEKIPSPTKSVKSYFSAPDSEHGDSPLKANLLLESPVSPMLSYAQNASGFLPQVTSTQVDKGSPSAGRTSNGFRVGYSSQFDVERHVDRVSELLEKDVDFDGWLRDVRTMEMSQD